MPIMDIQKDFERNYQLVRLQFSQVRQKFYFGSKNDRRCRFCDRAEPLVHFRKDAHVYPEALGNKRFFTYWECDDCNERFGGSIENDLGNFIEFERLIDL